MLHIGRNNLLWLKTWLPVWTVALVPRPEQEHSMKVEGLAAGSPFEVINLGFK